MSRYREWVNTASNFFSLSRDPKYEVGEDVLYEDREYEVEWRSPFVPLEIGEGFYVLTGEKPLDIQTALEQELEPLEGE